MGACCRSRQIQFHPPPPNPGPHKIAPSDANSLLTFVQICIVQIPQGCTISSTTSWIHADQQRREPTLSTVHSPVIQLHHLGKCLYSTAHCNTHIFFTSNTVKVKESVKDSRRNKQTRSLPETIVLIQNLIFRCISAAGTGLSRIKWRCAPAMK